MHYSLIVIGDGSLRDMLAPFDENLEVDEYVSSDVSLDDRMRMLDYYNERTRGHSWTLGNFDECYALFGKDWNNNAWRKNDEGVWQEFSTYNPNSKWDWYKVGGRWPGQLRVKEGVKTDPVEFSWGYTEADKIQFLKEHPRCADRAKKGDIENLAELHSWCVLKDGEWFETNWEDDKTLELLPFLDDVPDDTYITCVDIHM